MAGNLSIYSEIYQPLGRMFRDRKDDPPQLPQVVFENKIACNFFAFNTAFQLCTSFLFTILLELASKSFMPKEYDDQFYFYSIWKEGIPIFFKNPVFFLLFTINVLNIVGAITVLLFLSSIKLHREKIKKSFFPLVYNYFSLASDERPENGLRIITESSSKSIKNIYMPTLGIIFIELICGLICKNELLVLKSLFDFLMWGGGEPSISEGAEVTASLLNFSLKNYKNLIEKEKVYTFDIDARTLIHNDDKKDPHKSSVIRSALELYSEKLSVYSYGTLPRKVLIQPETFMTEINDPEAILRGEKYIERFKTIYDHCSSPLKKIMKILNQFSHEFQKKERSKERSRWELRVMEKTSSHTPFSFYHYDAASNFISYIQEHLATIDLNFEIHTNYFILYPDASDQESDENEEKQSFFDIYSKLHQDLSQLSRKHVTSFQTNATTRSKETENNSGLPLPINLSIFEDPANEKLSLFENKPKSKIKTRGEENQVTTVGERTDNETFILFPSGNKYSSNINDHINQYYMSNSTVSWKFFLDKPIRIVNYGSHHLYVTLPANSTKIKGKKVTEDDSRNIIDSIAKGVHAKSGLVILPGISGGIKIKTNADTRFFAGLKYIVIDENDLTRHVEHVVNESHQHGKKYNRVGR